MLAERGEPTYRLKQAYAALASSLVGDWREATSLPKGLREELSGRVPASVLGLRRLSRGEWTALASGTLTLLLLLLTARQLKPGAFVGKPLWIRLPAAGALATALLLALAASDYYLDERAFVSTAKARSSR